MSETQDTLILSPDPDVGLSFLYRSSRRGSRLSYPSFPTYYSLVSSGARFLSSYVYWIEIFLVLFFGIEYVSRLWSAGCRSKYMGIAGRFRFARKPIAIVDLLVVIASTLMITLAADRQAFAASAIRGVRFLQILRVLHVDRHGGTWRLLGSVVYIHRQELITTLYIGFLALIFCSYLVYIAEKDEKGAGDLRGAKGNDSHFESYADALWWGVITITTIGYGDVYPVTWVGKIIAACFAIFAISFFALPAGILGSGFALKVQQKQRQKHFSRQIPAAATLIQAAWRAYASAPGSTCVATWNMYLRSADSNTVSSNNKTYPPNNQTFGEKTAEKLRYLRLSTAHRKNRQKRNSQIPPSPNLLQSPMLSEPRGSTSSTSNTTGLDNNDHDDEDFEEEPIKLCSLTEDHKRMIRCVRKMQLIVARNRFQIARKPYDVRDVLEQYSHGHINMMMRIKELQRKIEHTIGKPASGTSDDRAKLTVLSRMQRVENAVGDMRQTMENILGLLKYVDEKIDRLSANNSQRSARSIAAQMNVKFSSVPEEIP
ncbi:hypothetical protein I4U23_025332 [Adineta vaga]|nr:hypothetical protein I4U23_025332 [Adineta vaga]